MKKKKQILIIGGIVLLVLVGTGIFLCSISRELDLENSPMPFSRLEIELLDSGELGFTAEIRRGELLSFLEREKPKLYTVLGFAEKLLPESVSVSGIVSCIKHSESKRVFKFRSLSLGGYKIPEKLLAGVGEFHLDFERSLVYNE